MMERRAAYAALEKEVLALYEQNQLTLAQLDALARAYCQIGIDSAGSQQIRTHDGKDLQQVSIELVDPTFLLARSGSCEDHEESWEQELKKWQEIVSTRWERTPEQGALPILQELEQSI